MGRSGGFAQLTPRGLEVGKVDTCDPWAVVRCVERAAPDVVALESFTAPRTLGPQTVAVMFAQSGIVLGVLAALGLPRILVNARTWQCALFGAPAKGSADTSGNVRASGRKKTFVDAARKRWPRLSFAYGDGRADAAWIAEWARRFPLAGVAW